MVPSPALPRRRSYGPPHVRIRSTLRDVAAALTRMAKLSAGLLLYRRRHGVLEVFLVHPGGPFWARKDEGAWSIPKGEYVDGEDPWVAAQREFEEELGKPPPHGPRIDFAPLKQPSGKATTAFAVRCDL